MPPATGAERRPPLPYLGSAMSRNQRIALVVVALLVAVAAFALARPGDDDGGDGAAQPAPPADPGRATTGERTERTETEPEPAPKPEIARIRIRGGAGGPSRIETTKGETVRIVVRADAPDEIHLHGYNITRNAAPASPARFRFEARIEGIFEMESHVAADAGKDPLVARLVVEP
jgi:hypothetical protein